MISRSTDIRSALKSRQRGFLLNPYRFGGGGGGGTTYATWNPSDKGTAVTLSNGNLTWANSHYNNSAVRSTTGKTTGKWYWELTIDYRVATSYLNVGVWPASRAISTYIYNTTGVYRVGNTHAVNDVFGVAFDAGAQTLAVYRNNTLMGSVSTGTISEPWHAVMGDDNSWGTIVTANFGATAHTYSPPSGFNAGLYS